MIKKLLKYLTVVLLTVIAIGAVTYLVVNQPLPDGTVGLEAEELADDMLEALNKTAYDSVEYIEFGFRGVHSYKWDKQENKVLVSWEDQTIFLDLNRSVNSFNLLELKAYKYFINDSFWLVAPFKVRDEGVTRSIVTLEDPSERGLLVTYASGGLTPGDSYLWIIDENGFPKAWKLWTSNVPIGGLKFTWDGWVNMDDKWFSTIHESSILSVPLEITTVR